MNDPRLLETLTAAALGGILASPASYKDKPETQARMAVRAALATIEALRDAETPEATVTDPDPEASPDANPAVRRRNEWIKARQFVIRASGAAEEGDIFRAAWREWCHLSGSERLAIMADDSAPGGTG